MFNAENGKYGLHTRDNIRCILHRTIFTGRVDENEMCEDIDF